MLRGWTTKRIRSKKPLHGKSKGRDKQPRPEVIQGTVLGHKVQVLSRQPSGRALCKGHVMLGVGDVPWLVETLSEQVKSGGVSFQPPESKLQKPFWGDRDHAWICRAVKPDGSVVRKQFPAKVSTVTPTGEKRMLTPAEAANDIAGKLQDAEQWQNDVREGLDD